MSAFKSKSVRRGLRLASVLAVVVALMVALMVAGCGGSTSATVGSTVGPGTPTVAAATATTGSSSTVTASKSLCNLLSVSDVSAVLGAKVSMVTSTKTTAADGSTAINCVYLPGAGGAHVDAAISYLFSSNGASAFASDKADDASRGDAETTLSGLGDAAFWGVAPLYKNTLQMTVQKGNVLMLMTLGGAGADGSTMVNGAVGLANKALPSL